MTLGDALRAATFGVESSDDALIVVAILGGLVLSLMASVLGALIGTRLKGWLGRARMTDFERPR